MNSSELIRAKILFTLKESERWMTGNEIIGAGNLIGLLEPKEADRRGHSHPVYRILSAMVSETDEHNVYSPIVKRRIRKSGIGNGCWEYAIKGTGNAIRRCLKAI